jgi:hypothetical protein
MATLGVAALVSGCTTHAAGTPQQAPYRPLPLNSVTASMATPVEDAIAYSPDGALAATRSQTGLCITHTGSGSGDDEVCADLGPAIGQALFSPDGSTLAVVESYQLSFRGRLWLVSTNNGHARQVAWPAFADAPATGGTDDRRTAPTRSSGSDPNPGNREPVAYLAVAWTEQGRLLALAAGMSGMAATDGSAPGVNSDHLISVDPTSGGLTDLGAVASGERRAAGTLVVGGGVALLTMLPDGNQPPQLLAVDLAARTTRALALRGDDVTNSSQVFPLAVAPNGASALLWLVDPVTLTQVPPARLDMDTGAVSVLDGTRGLMPTAGAYSPDGSQLALIVRDTGQAGDQLLVMPAEGGDTRSLIRLAGDLTPGTGLRWTKTDVLVPEVLTGMLSLDHLAPIRLSG